MRTLLALCLSVWLLVARPTSAADAQNIRLYVKPLLCVLDHGATSCTMTFDVRWKSALDAELCLSDGAPSPLRCWPSGREGAFSQERAVAEDFAYWLSAPTGTTRLAEVKIDVLRVDSADRRRERRARHVWDVL